MDSETMAKAYEGRDVETKWYRWWEEQRLFRADSHSSKPPFCIVIPPPNVTGTLHMGHALNNTLQDILCRYKRMKGYNVLWQPGTDHAGIATQNVVEKDLATKGLDRHDVGRDKFIDLVWQWRSKYGGLILNQLKRLGCSCDWSRERFTMDEGLSQAVREVFVTLYEQGLIYRGDYIINWCPRCQTALADLEVEHEDAQSLLYYVRYPLADGGGHLVVATTRPETMFGDTAVAVNPKDPRFGGAVGREVILPLVDKPIPVIADAYVDVEFGTGALKITPAHDPNDFEIGERHQLERIRVIDEDGRMNAFAGRYAGQDRFECRDRVVEDLEAAGLLEKTEPYRNAVGHCYRCKTVIEPLLSKQWFVKVGPLAAKALAAVREGRTRIVPANWQQVYYEWMENIRDWCISRQIWWGHRIPAWYCQDCGEVIVARETPAVCPQCKGGALLQEADVLDTWFSSGLWPFSTLGWPETTTDLQTFYPTTTLVTGFDILFFWVARMMMLGIHFMGEVPFRDVYIHALVRDAEGKKMSKSKGNVIDPLSVMDEFGTDAFRYTLAALAAQGRDIKLSEDKILGYRHFVNKLWNAARFVVMNLDTVPPVAGEAAGRMTLPDRWILTRLGQVSAAVDKALEQYRFNEAASLCYQFVWHELCDWYLEMAKPHLYGQDPALRQSTQRTARTALEASLKLLHPFMPFITEEIWHKLGVREGSISTETFPGLADFAADPEAVREMDLLMGIITSIRNIRGEMNVAPGRPVRVVIDLPEAGDVEVVRGNLGYIEMLGRTEEVRLGTGVPKPEGSATGVVGANQVHVILKGLLDFGEERRRLAKEIGKTSREKETLERKLANANFVAKAPAEIVEEVRGRLAGLAAALEKLQHNLDLIEAIDG